MLTNRNNENPIYKIAAEISNHDAAVLEEVSECLSNTEKYFSEHEEEYGERDITYDELGDFLYFMRELKGIKDNHLPLEEDWFDEDAEITDWCGIIDGKWVSQDLCVAAIDIESDSYVMFPCNINVLHKILQYAEKTGYRIARACDM